MTMLPNIAILGKAGAGKSTVAGALRNHFNYDVVSFAGPLKDVAEDLWGFGARTDRYKLQSLGVAVRAIDEDTWVDLFMDRVAALDSEALSIDGETYPICTDDCRFPNEYRRLKEVGWRFVRVHASIDTRVTRLRANGKLTDLEQLAHVSETSLDGYAVDYHLNNDHSDPDRLLENVTLMLNTLKARVA
jgi:dephospho-CoA kinase